MTTTSNSQKPSLSKTDSTSLPKAVYAKFRSLNSVETIDFRYARYAAIQIDSSETVWVHHFHNVDETALEGIDERIEKISKINDPGLVKIRDHFVDGSDLVLVTESIDGTRLDHLLDDVSPVVAEYWANYLSESLQAIHSSGEIHGSLVPQAIYKTNDGMKIIGAGLSKVWGPVLGKMPAMCTMSTRSFLSPEVRLDGIDAATHSSDVYSLGAILYSGYTRYNSSDICVMPSSKVDVPHHIDMAVMSAIHIDPLFRPQTVREFISAFYGSWEQHLTPENQVQDYDDKPFIEAPENTLLGKRQIGKWEARLYKVSCTLIVACFVVLLFVWSINLTAKLGENRINKIQQSVKEDILNSAKAKQEQMVVSRWSKLSLKGSADGGTLGLADWKAASNSADHSEVAAEVPVTESGETDSPLESESSNEIKRPRPTSEKAAASYSLWRDVTFGYVTN